jgi:HK97 family phage prohead protease
MKINNNLQQKFQPSLTINSNQKMRPFNGYAIVFDFKDLNNDIILKECFDDYDFSYPEIKLLWQHDMSEPIGTIDRFDVDDVGLFISGNIITTVPKGKEVVELISNDIISGLSIGFNAIDKFEQNGTKYITALQIIEISVVSIPCNQMCMIKLL